MGSMTPRGLNRVAAAEYIGVSPRKFDEMVKYGTMPGPRQIGRRNVFDVRELDDSFDELPRRDDENEWDDCAY